MLSLGARFPVRHLAPLGGTRRAFPCQGQNDVALVVTQSSQQPCFLQPSPTFHDVHHHANNSSRGGSPIFLPPLTTSTRGFSTSRIEKAGVSDSNSSNTEYTSEDKDDDDNTKNQQAAHTRLVFRRLYRILFRRINQLENALLLQQQHHAHAVDSSAKNNNNSCPLLLLQPLLNPHCVGSSRIIDNISNASTQQVLTLFYHWSLYAMGGLDDDNDGENENDKDDLEERFTDWLDAVCPDREHENTMQRQRHQYPWQENRALDTLWIRIPVLRQAIRHAFSAVSQPHNDDDDNGKNRRQFYIQASIQAYKFMSQQLAMIPLTSSSTRAMFITMPMDDDDDDDDETITTYDSDRGTFISKTKTKTLTSDNDEVELIEEMIHNKLIRVTAVSRWIGRSLASAATTGTTSSHDHHFVYRIRIENLTKSSDTENTTTSTASSSAAGGGGGGGTTVQLNGRSWEIESLPLNDKTDNDKDDRNQEAVSSARDIVKVHAPRKGAVGQYPLLGPQQAFEYYSRCNLSTPIGTMQGKFYFTIVSSDDDDLKGKELANRHFQVQVHPFSLRAERF